MGFLESLMRLFMPRRLPVPTEGPLPVLATSETVPFTIGVAYFAGDSDDNRNHSHFLEQLEGRTGIRLKTVEKTVRVEEGGDPMAPHSANMNARYLAAEENVDVLVWGEIVMDSLRIHFAPSRAPDEDRPGSFTVFTRLFLPLTFEEGYSDYLYMVLLTAADSVAATHHMAVRNLLPPVIDTVKEWLEDPPYDLLDDQKRDYAICFGHAYAVMGNHDPDGEWYKNAIELYQMALEIPVAYESSAETAQVRRHIAVIQLAMAEKSESVTDMEVAIGALRSILDTLTRGSQPQEWANTQNRLGLMLYKLDLKTGKTEPLKEAIQAFQAALQIYTRYEFPQKWADIMHNLAQALEVYGDQLKNPDVLDRAIDTCRLSLEARSREFTPLTWAATMNTLGAALFLKDKHTRNSTLHLDEAMQCLQAAIEVFSAHRADHWKTIAAKNLEHVEALMNTRRSRKVAEPNWVGVGKYDPSWLATPEIDKDDIRKKDGDGKENGENDAASAVPLLTGPSDIQSDK